MLRGHRKSRVESIPAAHDQPSDLSTAALDSSAPGPFEEGFPLRQHARPVELLGLRTPVARQGGREPGLRDRTANGPRHRRRVIGRDEEGVLPVCEKVREPAHVRADDAEARGLRLENAEGSVVDVRRIQEHVAPVEPRSDLGVRYGPGKLDPVRDAEFRRSVPYTRKAPVLVPSDHREVDGGKLRSERRDDARREGGVVDLVEGANPDETRLRSFTQAERKETCLERVRNQNHVLSVGAHRLEQILRRRRHREGRFEQATDAFRRPEPERGKVAAVKREDVRFLQQPENEAGCLRPAKRPPAEDADAGDVVPPTPPPDREENVDDASEAAQPMGDRQDPPPGRGQASGDLLVLAPDADGRREHGPDEEQRPALSRHRLGHARIRRASARPWTLPRTSGRRTRGFSCRAPLVDPGPARGPRRPPRER